MKMKTATKIFLAVIGVLLAATGLICICNPTGAITTVAWLVGLVLIISGVTTAIYYFAFGSFLVFAFPVLLNAIVDILFGVIFLQHPDGTSRVFTIVFGLALIGVGLLAVLVGFLARRFVENKKLFGGILIAGLAAIVLGIVAIASGEAGAFLIAIPVGVGLLALGAGYLALDVHLIRSDKAGTSTQYFKDVDD